MVYKTRDGHLHETTVVKITPVFRKTNPRELCRIQNPTVFDKANSLVWENCHPLLFSRSADHVMNVCHVLCRTRCAIKFGHHVEKSEKRYEVVRYYCCLVGTLVELDENVTFLLVVLFPYGRKTCAVFTISNCSNDVDDVLFATVFVNDVRTR